MAEDMDRLIAETEAKPTVRPCTYCQLTDPEARAYLERIRELHNDGTKMSAATASGLLKREWSVSMSEGTVRRFLSGDFSCH